MGILCGLLELYILALFGRIILSWFPISPGSALASIFSFLYTITEPVLGPVRRVMPPIGMGGMGLDLSPIIVTLLLQLLLAPALGCAGFLL
ncbi:MAG TPA: YggT family protein [Acidimicrobiales bacterium]|nr:YggT family protein [Acidimicrobiales bacterium]